MSTIVGIECTDGVLLAGDRLLVRDGTVESKSKQRVFSVDDVGAACVGPAGGIDEFGRRFESEVRSYETERGEMRIDPLATTLSSVVDEENVEAIVAARDEDGVARLRVLGTDGSVLDDSPAARGSGAPMLLGGLDETETDLDTAEAQVRDAFDAVADRDPETGDDVDLWRLESDA